MANKKHGEQLLPMHPPWPYASNYDLHKKAGGLPLLSFTVPNIHLSSKRKREVYKPGRKLTSLIKNVGPKGHITHRAGKKSFFLFVQLIHDQIVHGL